MKLRKEELKYEKSHPHDRGQNSHLEEEKKLCKAKNIFKEYINDAWYLYYLFFNK